MKNNPNQICWLLEKVPHSSNSQNEFNTFQQFLDNQQYTRRGILRYEKMFGAGYISTGGPSTTKVGIKCGKYQSNRLEGFNKCFLEGIQKEHRIKRCDFKSEKFCNKFMSCVTEVAEKPRTFPTFSMSSVCPHVMTCVAHVITSGTM